MNQDIQFQIECLAAELVQMLIEPGRVPWVYEALFPG